MASERRTTAGVSRATLIWTAALSAVVGFAAVYVTVRQPDNPSGVAGVSRGVAEIVRPVVPAAAGEGAVASSDAAATSAATAQALPKGPGANSLSKGQMAAFVFKKEPEDLPAFEFVDGEAGKKTMADWAGRVVLLNLWATWCAPCRKEMPGLARLQEELGSDRFEVVALAIDRGGIEKAKAFLEQTKATALRLYVDPTARLSFTLRAIGLPTTLLVKDGKEIGRLVGPAEWDSPEAKALIEAALR